MQRQTICVLLALLMLAGCATQRQQRATTTGAVVGAAAGTVVGAQHNRPLKGAVVGGIIGGLAGAVIGSDRNDVRASEPRYRRGCAEGARYFDAARRARDPYRRAELLHQGVRYCPRNPAAHNDLGVALLVIDRPREARNQFELALRIDPNYMPARQNLKHMNQQKQRFREDRHDRRDRRDYRYDD